MKIICCLHCQQSNQPPKKKALIVGIKYDTPESPKSPYYVQLVGPHKDAQDFQDLLIEIYGLVYKDWCSSDFSNQADFDRNLPTKLVAVSACNEPRNDAVSATAACTSCRVEGTSDNKQAQLHLSTVHLESILFVFSEAYLLWPSPQSHALSHIHVCMKAGHTPLDALEAWTHAHETACLLTGCAGCLFDVALAAVQMALHAVDADFPAFVEKAQVAGWQVDKVGLIMGALGSVAVDEGMGGVNMDVDAGHAVG
ncbi:uncharacterized protein LAESUDRAFT_713550 [Laetiporus sulphureus 93-53]|uniref:Uncharacterized protein n=1 Tax=Laetiporus sulphureus 93-53 TaxID=1314785 RepID=A0A165ENM0_9APHY|nr:uncharacterized protein LAESUDRAFT_713550 [Laetiporus sulphureus 93-53]KZT07437.1 hypothetical protein LAESUDRAFT_713550 [Laetiporus sulphureus 93-53]